MKPRLLDLFAGAGGASMGYHRAGFEVTGVDIVDQPHYPFQFIQADATTYPLDGFDVIHASPPCQDHSPLKFRAGEHGTGWMLNATIARLTELGKLFAVENVEAAKFPASCYRIRLCGSSFGLDVRRHRWFVTNVAMLEPPCVHHQQPPRFRSVDSRRGGKLSRVVGVHGHVNYAGEFKIRCEAMGINWMNNDELSQAIPPAYTQFIGTQLLEELSAPDVRMPA